jgi:bifunctional DNA-binding transcriptional regulator/antitoxin component of YhaV-PrlF toxin-antitoxin module
VAWHNPPVTTTVDGRRRVVIPFKPGDVLEVEKQSPDIVVLKRMKSAEHPKARLVKRKGRLVFVGEPITTQEVKSLLEDFP